MTVIPMGGREHPPEMVWQAQELYCIGRLSYRQVAEELGVHESTLKRWGKQWDWRDKREEYARAQAEMRGDLVLARSKLIKDLLVDGDPVVGFAVAKLEDLALKQAAAERESRKLAQASDLPRREIKTQADIVDALKEAVDTKLGRLLAQPEDVDTKAIKGIKDALELIGTMEAKDDKPKSGKGLTAEEAEEIRKNILGGG